MGDDSNAKKMTEGRRSFLAKALGVLAGTSLFGGAGKLVAQTVKRNTVSSTGPKQVADTTPYVGEILLFAGNFAPVGWAFCDGQILAISDYDVLFSILGTTYGGNGTTNFALPDLRGRVPIGFGQGAGLSNYDQGQIGGEENHTLTTPEMPQHTHSANADTAGGTSDSPSNNVPAVNNEGIQHYGSTVNGTMNSNAIGTTGGSQAHNNLQPYLAMNYIISLEGVYPSRS